MNKKKKEGEFVATIRLEIIKPLDGDWDAVGPAMRALRAPIHRVLNGTITDLEVEERAGRLGRKEDGKIPAQTRCYQLVRDLWFQEREEAAERVAANARDKKKAVYPGDEKIATTQPSGMVILGLASAVFTRWQYWRAEKWKGKISLPSFKGGLPIYVASSNDSVSLTSRDGSAILRVPLFGGGDDSRPTRVQFVVRPYGGSGFATLKRLLAEPDNVCDCRIVEEDGRDGKRKWFAFVSYKAYVKPVTSGRTMALHRGVRTFLTAAIARSDDGKEAYTVVLADGGDIRAHKAGYDARRQSLGRHRRELGAGARGHGQARREEHITRLEDAEARWVRTKCQQIAASAVKLAIKRGVSKILIEDWSNPAKDGAPELGEYVERIVRRFPLAELKGCIEWAAKKNGLQFEQTPSDGNSRTCPNCGHEHDAEQGSAFGKSGTFRCEKCMLERPVDMIYPWNMLIRDGKPSPLPDQIRATKRTVGRLKAAPAAKAPAKKRRVEHADPAE